MKKLDPEVRLDCDRAPMEIDEALATQLKDWGSDPQYLRKSPVGCSICLYSQLPDQPKLGSVSEGAYLNKDTGY